MTFIFILGYTSFFYFYKHDKYKNILNDTINIYTYGLDAPRGKIYDINGKVLVDNIITNNLVFRYEKGLDLVQVSKDINKYFDFKIGSINEQINYYKAINDENDLLTLKEKNLIKNRKISKDEINNILNERIKIKIESFTEEDKKISKIYSILDSGANYEIKVLKKDISDEEVSIVLNNKIKGVYILNGTKRYYPYEDTLKNIFGKVGNITVENKNYYLQKGYNLSDEVGSSYLEKYYDDFLKGKKAKYKVNKDNSLTLISKEEKGADIYLSIDIDLQLKVDEIIKNDLIKAKNMPNTNYLTDSYVIVGNPLTGQINAISGWRYLDNKSFNNIVLNNISSSFTMGSVVKGATISVGYKYNLIDPYKLIYDDCVKLYLVPQKCSHRPLGYLNAITALKESSNYYQFLIAISLLNKTYTPNMVLKVSQKEFDIYRNMLSSYGLGIKTGIDLEGETIGLKGNKISDDLLLNLSIGQYDAYTPIQLFTYINTIASSGQRRKPSLVSYIKKDNKIIYENSFDIVQKVDITSEDMSLIKEGFYEVMNHGTGLGFYNLNIKPAGKTGTSESFLDLNNDGKVDTSTITLTNAAYFPYDNPSKSIIVISPHVSYNNEDNNYIYYLTAQLSRDITDFIFANS